MAQVYVQRAGLGAIGVETVDYAASVSCLRIIRHALQDPAFPAKIHLLSEETLIEAKNITLKVKTSSF
jgi:hypothetical protein